MLSCIHKKKGGEHNEGTNEERHSRSKRAALYFSKKALDFAKNLGKQKACSYFGIGERCSLYEYFTLYGLELAATFDNISLLLDEEEAG